MAPRTRPEGYSTLQIILHWAIAALVLFQVIFGENIVPAWRAFRRGTEPGADATFGANVHVYIGITVFVLAIWRLGLRLGYGAPPAPAGEGTIQKWIAAATHFVLYAVIIGMPISGGVAWFLGVEEAGEVHEAGKAVIIVFVTLHVLAALYQHFFARTNVLTRMIRPVRRAA